MAPDPDAALMLAFQGGDEAAFRTLFEKYGRAMVAFCHHYVRDLGRAEELAQDVFLKLYRYADRYRPSARFRTFLYRIAANHCLNELRRGEHGWRAADPGKDGADLELVAGKDPSPEEVVSAAALSRAVQELLARLPEKQRSAFVLARLEGLSYEEVADVLETTVSAVKSLVHRATVAAADALESFSAPGDRKEVRQ